MYLPVQAVFDAVFTCYAMFDGVFTCSGGV